MGFCTKFLTFTILLISIFLGTFTYITRTPGPSGFSYISTAKQVLRNIDLKGKNAIVTGGYSGIGITTVEALSEKGAKVWIPTRPSSMNVCEKVVKDLKKKTGNEAIFCEEMDLGSLASVKRFAEKWKKLDLPLHILINNAGIMACPYAETVDGFESQFGTNHLGHFLLTNLLLSNLEKGKPSRVVSVSSTAHSYSGIHFDDLTGKNTWYNGTDFLTGIVGPWRGYGQSKTANILFAIALNERMKNFGNANSLHPGGIKTNLQKHVPQIIDLIFTATGYLWKTAEQGASTQVYVATAPELEGVGGLYFEDCNISAASPFASDKDAAERLWKISEELTQKYLK